MTLECKYNNESLFIYDTKKQSSFEIDMSTDKNLQKSLSIELFINGKFDKYIVFDNLPLTAKGVLKLTLKIDNITKNEVVLSQVWLNQNIENTVKLPKKKMSLAYKTLSFALIGIISTGCVIFLIMSNWSKFNIKEKKVDVTVEKMTVIPDVVVEKNEKLKEIENTEHIVEKSVKDKKYEDFVLYLENNNIYFIKDSVILIPEQEMILKKVAEYIIELEIDEILLEGHSASIGFPIREKSLSKKRATYIAKYLENLTNNTVNYKIISYGSTSPVKGNNLKIDKSLNRRVEIKL